ncbi:hypothetical protein H8D36_07265 [archaeon]|nr:hypothetical protein [archaeon]MBL7057112.1 hypothetical protein [Candidatus Woesearchaeota archaeon]
MVAFIFNKKKKFQRQVENILADYVFLTQKGPDTFSELNQSITEETRSHLEAVKIKRIKSLIDGINWADYHQPREMTTFLEDAVANFRTNDSNSYKSIVGMLSITDNPVEVYLLTKKLEKGALPHDRTLMQTRSSEVSFYNRLRETLSKSGAISDLIKEKKICAPDDLSWMELAQLNYNQMSNDQSFKHLKDYIGRERGIISTQGGETAVGMLYKNLFWDNDLDGVFFQYMPELSHQFDQAMKNVVLASSNIEEADANIFQTYKSFFQSMLTVAEQSITYQENNADNIAEIPFRPGLTEVAKAVGLEDELKRTYTPHIIQLKKQGDVELAEQFEYALGINISLVG